MTWELWLFTFGFYGAPLLITWAGCIHAALRTQSTAGDIATDFVFAVVPGVNWVLALICIRSQVVEPVIHWLRRNRE